MAPSEPTQCPVCGWTGERTDLERTGSEENCPACGESIAVE